MSNLGYWKQAEQTQQILKEIEEEIQKSKEELTDGTLLLSTALEREYSNSVGYIKGLEFLKEIISREEELVEYDSNRSE